MGHGAACHTVNRQEQESLCKYSQKKGKKEREEVGKGKRASIQVCVFLCGINTASEWSSVFL